MKYPYFFRNVAFILAATCIFILCGSGGCASREYSQLPILHVPEDLSRDARTTYAYLLFDQSLRQGDEEALEKALRLLMPCAPPLHVYMDAGAWLLSHNSPLALPTLQAGLKSFPKELSLHILYVEALSAAGHDEEAFRHMRVYAGEYPDNSDALVEMAILYLKRDEAAEAEALLRPITGDKRSAMVEYYHARALLAQKREDEALPHLRRAVELSPDFVEAIEALAGLLTALHKEAEALQLYQRLLQDENYASKVLLALTMIKLRMKEPDKALEYAEKIPPTSSEQLHLIGLFIEAGAYVQAEKLLLRLRPFPKSSPELFLFMAGVRYELHKDLPGAMQELQQVSPDTPRAYARAQLLMAQLPADAGKFEDALKNARRGQKFLPDQPDLFLLEIRLLISMERIKEAERSVRRFLKRWPDDEEALFLHAFILDEQGRKKAAFQAMEKLISLYPENAQGLNYIGYTLAEEKRDLDRALRLLHKAAELSPSSAYITDSLAWAQFQAGQLDEAWKSISRAVTLEGKGDPAIWEHYGDIARARNAYDAARHGYQKALELTPGNAAAIRTKLSALPATTP